jgi:NAD(P)-dependent dehydrogenase (short-subunit alcohol dehydrogenase family)
MEFANKVVVITGAGKGIGKIAAEKFAAEGASVAVASRTEGEIDKVVSGIRDAGGKAIAVPTDISQPDSVEGMIDQVISEFGHIDVLINNAAMPGRPGRSELHLWEMELDDWDFVYGINVRGTMMCSKYALPHMIERGSGGSIIIVSSTAGRRGMPKRTHYCSSKAALFGLTQSLAWDCGPHNIRVNCVVPGATMTELIVAMFERHATEQGRNYEEIVSQSAVTSPQGKIADPGEVAELMLYLASDKASAINGQTIDPNYGSFMA